MRGFPAGSEPQRAARSRQGGITLPHCSHSPAQRSAPAGSGRCPTRTAARLCGGPPAGAASGPAGLLGMRKRVMGHQVSCLPSNKVRQVPSQTRPPLPRAAHRSRVDAEQGAVHHLHRRAVKGEPIADEQIQRLCLGLRVAGPHSHGVPAAGRMGLGGVGWGGVGGGLRGAGVPSLCTGSRPRRRRTCGR